LGDSLAFGYQPNGDYLHGYAAYLYGALKQKYPTMGLKNLGCVAETTSTMLGLDGKICPYGQYTGGITATAQITYAINYLDSHQGQVKLITLDIGANDAIELIASHPTTTTLLTGLGQISTNLDRILTELQDAANNTGNQNARIIIMTNYNPLVVTGNSFITLAGQILNNTLRKVVANHASVSIADVYSALNPPSDPAALICQVTWYCSSTHPDDPHPHPVGYRIIAALFWQAGANSV